MYDDVTRRGCQPIAIQERAKVKAKRCVELWEREERGGEIFSPQRRGEILKGRVQERIEAWIASVTVAGEDDRCVTCIDTRLAAKPSPRCFGN